MEQHGTERAYRSFNAAEERLAIISHLLLEFAGVTFEILPKKNPHDFQEHIKLEFSSEEQAEAFMSKMLAMGQAEAARRRSPQ